MSGYYQQNLLACFALLCSASGYKSSFCRAANTPLGAKARVVLCSTSLLGKARTVVKYFLIWEGWSDLGSQIGYQRILSGQRPMMRCFEKPWIKTSVNWICWRCSQMFPPVLPEIPTSLKRKKPRQANLTHFIIQIQLNFASKKWKIWKACVGFRFRISWMIWRASVSQTSFNQLDMFDKRYDILGYFRYSKYSRF